MLAIGSAFVSANQAANQAATQATIRAEALEIVDSNGRVRARIGKSDSESVAFTIQTADGRPRLSLFGGERGSAVNLFQGGQFSGAASMTAYQDSTSLSLRGANGMLRAQMSLEGDRVRLNLCNTDGKTVFTAPSGTVAN
jgi:hypothetical protein